MSPLPVRHQVAPVQAGARGRGARADQPQQRKQHSNMLHVAERLAECAGPPHAQHTAARSHLHALLLASFSLDHFLDRACINRGQSCLLLFNLGLCYLRDRPHVAPLILCKPTRQSVVMEGVSAQQKKWWQQSSVGWTAAHETLLQPVVFSQKSMCTQTHTQLASRQAKHTRVKGCRSIFCAVMSMR